MDAGGMILSKNVTSRGSGGGAGGAVPFGMTVGTVGTGPRNWFSLLPAAPARGLGESPRAILFGRAASLPKASSRERFGELITGKAGMSVDVGGVG